MQYSLALDQSIENIQKIFQKFQLDSFEFMCLKAIVFFRADKTLQQAEIIENLQDQAQIALAQYTQIHHPTRYKFSFFFK